jgi:hypothetical protein
MMAWRQASGRVQPARFSLIALDESADEEEDVPLLWPTA